MCVPSGRHCSLISTHALTEGDFFYLSSTSIAYSFQLTPSRRATHFDATNSIIATFQLTPSRRATAGAVDPLNEIYISTHALTEGDTPQKALECGLIDISTHALPVGDGSAILKDLVPVNFNSRPHGGRRAIMWLRT